MGNVCKCGKPDSASVEEPVSGRRVTPQQQRKIPPRPSNLPREAGEKDYSGDTPGSEVVPPDRGASEGGKAAPVQRELLLGKLPPIHMQRELVATGRAAPTGGEAAGKGASGAVVHLPVIEENRRQQQPPVEVWSSPPAGYADLLRSSATSQSPSSVESQWYRKMEGEYREMMREEVQQLTATHQSPHKDMAAVSPQVITPQSDLGSLECEDVSEQSDQDESWL